MATDFFMERKVGTRWQTQFLSWAFQVAFNIYDFAESTLQSTSCRQFHKYTWRNWIMESIVPLQYIYVIRVVNNNIEILVIADNYRRLLFSIAAFIGDTFIAKYPYQYRQY